MRRLLMALVVVVAVPVSAMASPRIEVSPYDGDNTTVDWDFGNVAVGSSKTTIVTITNVGGNDLFVSYVGIWDVSQDPDVISDDFFVQTVLDFPVLIPPYDPDDPDANKVDVTVAFAPQELGDISAWLFISSNDDTQPLTTVNLAGVGVV